MHRFASAMFAASALFLFACLGHAKSGAVVIAPSSGKQMCSALSPADFTKAGVAVTSLREANVDGDASAYCVYDAKAGKVEFDIFYPAGDTIDAAKGTERTVLKEVGGKFESIAVAGADSAEINLAVPGKPLSASICVRKNLAVFTVNIPQSPQAREQLLSLTQTLLSRLQQ